MPCLLSLRKFVKYELPIKLLSTDFDGTLFSGFDYPPVPRSLQAKIAELQAQGAKWMINTGRDLTGLMEIMARSHLTIKPDYLGCVEREIYVHDGKRYTSLSEWNDACTRSQAEVFSRIREDLPQIIAWVNQHFDATVYEDIYSPFCLVAENNPDADKIVAYVEDYCQRIPKLTIVRNDVYARLSHTDFNKGSVVTEVARRLGLTSEQVFVAGDHFNDLPMLQIGRARWLAAPENAVDEVKHAVLQQGGYVSQHPSGRGTLDGLLACLKAAGYASPSPT
ncbi:MAG: HAD-IIB family hydrolase [Verrucomicrobiota bacterium]